MPVFFVILLYALFGLTFTLGKVTLFYAKPFFIIGFRMLVGGIGLLSYIFLTKKIHCYPTKSDRWYYLQGALFGIFVPYSCRAWALQYITTAKSAFLFNLMPFFTAIFAYIFFKEKLSHLKIFGLVIGFCGTIPLLLTGTKLEDSVGMLSFISIPELITLVAVASFSYHFIIMQTLVKHRGCAPILANGMSMFFGGLLAFSTSAIVEPVWITNNAPLFFALLSIQILISNVICLNLQATLLKHYSSTFMALASFISPLCAAFYGSVFLGETITWHFFLSLGLVITGLIIYYYDDIRTKKLILD